MADIFHEIEEELRRDRAQELWRRYGKYLIAFAVAAILATAAFVAWQNYSESRREAEGRNFALAMEKIVQKDMPAAKALLAQIAGNGGGYAVLARFQQAALDSNAGKPEGAAAIYDALAADDSVMKPFRDLATVLSAMATFDKADPAAIQKKLEPLSAAGEAFRPSALELRGLAAIRAGDFKDAKKLFQDLSDDLAAPAGMRQRATQILTWIGERGG